MVQFVSVDNIIRFIRDIGVEQVVTGIADRIEQDFKRWDVFEKQPRIASHSDDGVIELMPTCDGDIYAFKYVNGHPGNFNIGKQTVTGFGLLADVATGYPLFLSEMTILTALRTAAMSALAGKYLAPRNADVMAMIGTGAQAEFQAHAFMALCGIKTVRIFDIDPAAMDKFARNMNGSGLQIIRCHSADEAVIGAQIITTCTADKKKARVLHDNMVGRGIHINAIGGDCPGKTEIDADVLQKAKIFVELEEQTRIEGEIQQLAPDHPVTPLWQVLSGQAEGRQSADQITLFDSVGFAIEDFSALIYLRDAVAGTPYADTINLLALPKDPKDLFGLFAAFKDGIGDGADIGVDSA